MINKEEKMKKAISMLLLVLFAASLTACATTTGTDAQRVKCPACGYEFDVPAERK